MGHGSTLAETMAGVGAAARIVRRAWTPVEIAVAGDMYPHCHTGDIAAWLERTAGSVYQLAGAYGWHKSAEYLSSDSAGRVRRGKQCASMIASQFKPGQVAWNKGRPYREWGSRNAAQFKRGHRPQTWHPIGTTLINKDGVLEVKVSDDKDRRKRWAPVHRLVWEAAHGPVPDGSVVIFKPGMRNNVREHITVDKLMCLTRAELVKHNHPRNRDPELGRLIQLKGAITRQVNRINREATA